MNGEPVRRSCPRCSHASLEPVVGVDAPTPVLACPSCGLRLTSEALGELAYLDDLQSWTVAKRQWIIDRAAEGNLTPTQAPSTSVETAPSHPRSTAPSAAGCLLATGVFALVAAGLAFTAFAWGFLGAFGQLMVLVLVGLAAMAGGYALARRVPGTAAALSITGVLLLVVASGFLLDAESLGSPWVRAIGVAVVGSIGVASSYRQARRQPGAAVVTASVFAVLVLVAAAVAPFLGVDRDPTWVGWWVAGVLLVWGAALLLLELAEADRPWHRMPWSWFGGAGLLVGVMSLAGVTGDRLDVADRLEQAPLLLPSLILLVGAMGFLLLDRLTRARWWVLPIGSMVLMGATAILLMSSVGDPSSRPWAVIPAVLLTLLLVAAAAHLNARSGFAASAATSDDDPIGSASDVEVVPPAVSGPTFVQRWAGVLIRLSMVSAGGVVALALSPTVDQQFGDFPCAYPPCTDPGFSNWLEAGYPWWRGVLVALVATLVSLVSGLLVRRSRGEVWSSAPVVIGVATIVWWSWVVWTDASNGPSDIDAARSAVTGALVIGGLGLLAVFTALRESPLSLWVAAGIAATGGQVAWTWLELGDWTIGPELHGLFVAVPLLLAGMILLLRSPHHEISTWGTVGPALVAALVFPVAAVVDDTLQRSFSFSNSSMADADLVRIVVLLAVGVILAVLGARGHWSAVFWPGLATVVVVAGVQILDVASRLPQWVSLTVVGVVLLLAGARWESVRLRGRRTRQWAGTLH